MPSSSELLARCDRDCPTSDAEIVTLARDRAALAQREPNAVIVRCLEPHERLVLRAAGAHAVVVRRATATTALVDGRVRRWFAGIDVDKLPGVAPLAADAA